MICTHTDSYIACADCAAATRAELVARRRPPLPLDWTPDLVTADGDDPAERARRQRLRLLGLRSS